MVVRDKDKSGQSAGLVPAVDKAFRVLDVLKVEGREYTIVEIAKEIGLNKSTVQKLLVTLSHYGVVQRDESTKRYSLGIALAEYGRIALQNIDIRQIAKPFLQTLSERTGETAVLAVQRGTKVVMVDKREPPVQIRVSSPVGRRYPMTASVMGKTLMAWLTEDRCDEIMRKEGLPAMTPSSITDPAIYRAELAKIRERGYATDHEEFHPEVHGVAAPVFNSRGRIVAALAVGGPAFRMTEDKMENCARKCVELAKELSSKL